MTRDLPPWAEMLMRKALAWEAEHPELNGVFTEAQFEEWYREVEADLAREARD